MEWDIEFNSEGMYQNNARTFHLKSTEWRLHKKSGFRKTFTLLFEQNMLKDRWMFWTFHVLCLSAQYYFLCICLYRPSLTWVLKTLQPIYGKKCSLEHFWHSKWFTWEGEKNLWVANFAFFFFVCFFFFFYRARELQLQEFGPSGPKEDIE